MQFNVCVSKIHRATVTDADLNYKGSITLDPNLLEAAHLFAGQMVQITNLSNGVLWRTYILEGERGKGEVVLNGPPARHFRPSDKVIILGEAWVQKDEVKDTHPTTVFVDDTNNITEVKESKWHE